MATACYINRYKSYSDRGAFVQEGLWTSAEIDEEDLKAGQPLTIGTDKGVVTHYDGHRLEFDYRGESYSIEVGEEKKVDESIFSQEHGVTCFLITTVKVIPTQIQYLGDFQWEDTILQRLQGPIGEGKVLYPNGDRFEGWFHLNYAHINGPAYCADGRYDFADGSYIEHAWIQTSSDLKTFNLHGVYRIKRPEGPDSIAMFVRGRKYGVELILNKNLPSAREWYAGVRCRRAHYNGSYPEDYDLDVIDYKIDEEGRKDCLSVAMTLRDINVMNAVYKVKQSGGGYHTNNYDQSIYEPSVSETVHYPGGDSVDHFGDSLKLLEPYEGWMTMHCAGTGKCRRERWEKGRMVEAEEWTYDPRAAKRLTLPDPLGGETAMKADVWPDGHITYNVTEWEYDGEIKNDRPEGQGVLVGKFSHEGCRYKGGFLGGRCHGKGVYVNRNAGITQDGDWVDGRFLEPNAATEPIAIHARHGHQHWSMGSDNEWEYREQEITAQLGGLDFEGFNTFKIVRIEKDCITITHWERTLRLLRGETLNLSNEIEGREWSDGCVYDGDEYTLELTWIK